jgi:hypothetical protein
MEHTTRTPDDPAELKTLMETLGITHTLADIFSYRDYRYGKIEDAVAQAMRDRKPAPQD